MMVMRTIGGTWRGIMLLRCALAFSVARGVKIGLLPNISDDEKTIKQTCTNYKLETSKSCVKKAQYWVIISKLQMEATKSST